MDRGQTFKCMLPLLRILTIASALFTVALPAAETASGEASHKPNLRGSFETFELPILDLQTLDFGDGYTFQTVQVELAGKKVWTSSVLGLGEVKVGDTVQIMVNKHEIPDKRTGTIRKAVMIQVMPDFRKQLRDLEKVAPSATDAH